MDAEDAHHFTLNNLMRAQRMGLAGCLGNTIAADPRTVMGVRFPNPAGLAAGLDKDGAYIDGLSRVRLRLYRSGHGHAARAASATRVPRMFRLPQADALINRMGFNNGGVDAFVANVQASRWKAEGGVLGLNIGKNADTPIERARRRLPLLSSSASIRTRAT